MNNLTAGNPPDNAENPKVTNVDLTQKTKFSQWASLPDNQFIPSLNTIESLPSGLYELRYDNQRANIMLIKKTFELDELYELPSREIIDILDDIKLFWDNKNLFKKYKYIHKRGILLYGQPGCGKSGIIQLCIKYLIENKNGIIINIKDRDDVENYVYYISTIRQIEIERPIIVVIEDIDSIVSDDNYMTSKVLNILDGIKQIGDVVYLATTNYPEKLEERISNRPSRFDRRYEIGLPNDEIRRVYLINKLGKDFKDLDLWVNETKDMSLAHLKDLVVSVILLGNKFEDTILMLRNMKNKIKSKTNGTVSLGFSK